MPDTAPLKAPSKARLIVKLSAAILAALLLLVLVFSLVSSLAEGGDATSDADYVNWCERDYRARDYARLFETLTLYDLYDQRYDLYWEATEGHETLLLHRQWCAAAAAGEAGAQQKAEALLGELKEKCEHPRHAENASLLNGFYAQADALARGAQQTKENA